MFLFFTSPLFEVDAAQGSTKDDTGVENIASSETSVKVNKLLEQLAINQGKGQFVQQKYFSFMSVPITSSGNFVVKGESALWQTQQPVFSALLLTPQAIYRRLSLDEEYQLLTDSAEFSGVLSAIFTGKVNADDWLLNNSTDDACLELTPKSEQLKQLFKQVDLCLVSDTNRTDTDGQSGTHSQHGLQLRQITLTDSKGDKTVITMSLSDELFLPSDSKMLKLS